MIMGVAPPRSAECGRSPDFALPHPTPLHPAHSDPLEPPEEAALVARVLKAGVYRQQQPIRVTPRLAAFSRQPAALSLWGRNLFK